MRLTMSNLITEQSMTSNQIHHKWKNIEHKQSQLSKGITKDPHELGSKKMGKIQKSQSGQQIILRKPTHDNTWIYQLKQVRIRTIPQQTKQGQSQKSKQTHNEKKQNNNTNIHENEVQNTSYEVRKWEPIPFSWRFGGEKVKKWSL